MSELEPELEDSIEEDEVEVTESTDESTEDTSEEDLKAKNEWLYERARKAEAKLKKQKETSSKKSPARKHDFDIEDIVDLRVAGYSKEELEKAKAIARGQGIGLSDAVSDPFFQAGIQAMRDKQDTTDATPSPSSKPAPTGNASKKAWGDMTAEERSNNFGAFSQGFKKKGGRSNE